MKRVDSRLTLFGIRPPKDATLYMDPILYTTPHLRTRHQHLSINPSARSSHVKTGHSQHSASTRSRASSWPCPPRQTFSYESPSEGVSGVRRITGNEQRMGSGVSQAEQMAPFGRRIAITPIASAGRSGIAHPIHPSKERPYPSQSTPPSTPPISRATYPQSQSPRYRDPLLGIRVVDHLREPKTPREGANRFVEWTRPTTEEEDT